MKQLEDTEQSVVAKYGPLIEKADEHEKPKIIAEYRRALLRIRFKRHVETAGGGMFTPKTRKRLSGTLGLSGRERTKKDFWEDVRDRVKRALVDLQLFIEIAEEDQVNQVITQDTLKPIVMALLWSSSTPVEYDPQRRGTKLRMERARIALLFIKWGFEYLSNMNQSMMTSSHSRTMTDAIDLSKFLLDHFPDQFGVDHFPENKTSQGLRPES
jgi:hypothetical protein